MKMRRTISFIVAIILSLTAVQLSALASSSSIASAAYDAGIVSVRGTGFTAGTTYLVKVVNTASSSIQALGNATATEDGSLSGNILTGALTPISDYVVKINDAQGYLAASAGITDGAAGTTTPSTPQSTPTPTATPSPEPSGKITVQATVDSAGRATATVSEAVLSEAVKKAEAAGGAQAADVIVEITITADSAKAISLALTKASIMELADSKVGVLRIHTGAVTLSLDKKTLDAMKRAMADEAATGTVILSITALDPSAALQKYAAATKKSYQEQIGDRPLYDLSITAGKQKLTDFKGGTVNVTLSYSLSAGEDDNAIVIYYMDEQGKLKIVTNSGYNSATKTVSFKVKHFSSYAVGYNEKKFVDVTSGAWFSNAVGFAAARGITNGIDATHFAPGRPITRGDFLMMVMKAYGIEAESSLTDNFADAGQTYYTDYVGTAKKLGFITGSGNNRFQPDKAITRQDMCVILYQILESIGELPSGTASGKTLADYKDGTRIAAYAVKAMKLFVETGLVSGSNGSLMPKGATTRAETVQLLYGLMKP